MKVKDLIKELKKYDFNLDVFCTVSEYDYVPVDNMGIKKVVTQECPLHYEKPFSYSKSEKKKTKESLVLNI